MTIMDCAIRCVLVILTVGWCSQTFAWSCNTTYDDAVIRLFLEITQLLIKTFVCMCYTITDDASRPVTYDIIRRIPNIFLLLSLK
jgi:hypothetical protein